MREIIFKIFVKTRKSENGEIHKNKIKKTHKINMLDNFCSTTFLKYTNSKLVKHVMTKTEEINQTCGISQIKRGNKIERENNLVKSFLFLSKHKNCMI